jgi:hypothetical protein
MSYRIILFLPPKECDAAVILRYCFVTFAGVLTTTTDITRIVATLRRSDAPSVPADERHVLP